LYPATEPTTNETALSIRSEESDFQRAANATQQYSSDFKLPVCFADSSRTAILYTRVFQDDAEIQFIIEFCSSRTSIGTQTGGLRPRNRNITETRPPWDAFYDHRRKDVTHAIIDLQ